MILVLSAYFKSLFKQAYCPAVEATCLMFLSEPSFIIYTLSMPTVNTLTRLHICTGSAETYLLNYTINPTNVQFET